MSRIGRPYGLTIRRDLKDPFVKRKIYEINDYSAIPQLGEPDPEPEICSHFGCGRKLSLREKLFGNKCVNHSIDYENRKVQEYKNSC